MKHEVFVHGRAIDDIERNARWWAEHHSDSQALRWYEAAFADIYGLDTMPKRHGLSQENDDFPFEIRDMLFGLGSRPSYSAVFTIKGTEVHVLCVQRSSEDNIGPDDIDFES